SFTIAAGWRWTRLEPSASLPVQRKPLRPESAQALPRHAHESLAEVLALEEPHEGGRRVFEALRHVLAMADAAVGEAGGDGTEKVGVVVRSELDVDEAADGQAFGQHRTHGRGEEVWPGSLAARVVLRDQPADRHPRILVQQRQHGLPDRAAD